MEEVDGAVVLPFVVLLFDHRGLVVLTADFVQVRGQHGQTEPPMRKSNADTHVIWHVKFRPEIADVTGVDGDVTGKLSATHLQLDRDPADGWNLCTDSIRPLVRKIFDLGGCLLRRMSAGN